MPGMFNLSYIIEFVIGGSDNVPFSEKQFV